MFLDKFSKVEERFLELEKALSQKKVIEDREKFQSYSKEFSELQEVVSTFREYKKTEKEIKDSEAMLKDPEMIELAQAELKNLEIKKEELKGQLEIMMLGKDPLDQKNIIIEIRAGTGGEEAALFAAELLRMYLRYAEKHNFKTEMIDTNPTGLGGIKEAHFSIIGKGAYSRLKYEGGTHRVQRVPETESGGRIHTSAATVAVLPEAEDVDVHIEDKDLRVDTYRASGAGGQNVNKVSSAVRITHLPTGLVVTCQEERSQHQNRFKAMKLLRARLFEMKEEKRLKERAQARKIMVGTGDRSEKIRTYNFPQGRITDHRIGFTVYKLHQILDGELNEIIDALAAADKVAKLEKLK